MIRRVLTDPWLHAAVLSMMLTLSLMYREIEANELETIRRMTVTLCGYLPTISSVAKIAASDKTMSAIEIANAICLRANTKP